MNPCFFLPWFFRPVQLPTSLCSIHMASRVLKSLLSELQLLNQACLQAKEGSEILCPLGLMEQ